MKLLFLRKNNVGGNVVSFTFKPTEPLQWQAGQSVRLEIPCGFGSDERRFTISSAPFEQTVTISTRITSSTFKQALANLQPGVLIDGYGAEGDFTWPNDVGTVLFVAVGVGITPYISMLRQRAHEQLPLSATLLFADTTSGFPFADEISAIPESAKDFNVIFKYDKLQAADIAPYLTSNIHVYLSGPATMVMELANKLIEDYGIPPQRLKRDLFSGKLVG